METSREAARIAIENTIMQLKEVVPGVPLDAPITLQAITPYAQTMQTTFGREVVHHKCRRFGFVDHLILSPSQLWFAELHAVHHWSMVGVTQVYGHLISGADISGTDRFA